MITVRLLGGLGNQLFQIAAGDAVARERGTTVRFDCSWYVTGRHGERQLEVEPLLAPDELVMLSRLGRRAAYHPKNPVHVQERSVDDDSLARISRLTRFLSGYFQRADYVEPATPSMADRLAPVLHALRPDQAAVGAIGLHVRLGDYYRRPDTRAYHGVTAPSYFGSAAQQLVERHAAPVVIFTDTPDVAATHFVPRLGVRVEAIIHKRNAWETLADMSSCSALVLANSSLSWWAAYVASRIKGSEIDVVMPTPWFAHPSAAEALLQLPEWHVRQRTLAQDNEVTE